MTTKQMLKHFVQKGGVLACEIPATLPGRRAWLVIRNYHGFFARKFELKDEHHQRDGEETYEQYGLQEVEVKARFDSLEDMLEWVAQYESDLSKFRWSRDLEWLPMC